MDSDLKTNMWLGFSILKKKKIALINIHQCWLLNVYEDQTINESTVSDISSKSYSIQWSNYKIKRLQSVHLNESDQWKMDCLDNCLITMWSLLLLWQYPLSSPLHQLLQTISLLGRWSSSGSNRGIAHFFTAQKYNQGSGRKRELGLTQVQEGWFCDTVHSCCICRLTLTWISSEISTKLLGMPTHLDWSSLTVAGLSHATGLSDVRCRLLNCHPASLIANSLLWVPSSNSLTGVPFLLLVALRPRVQTLCLVLRQNRQRDRLLGRPPT